MIKLTQIDETNFLECFALRLDNGQERFVSSPIRSLAQAYVYRDQCMPFGIYAGDKMIGYVMVIYDREEQTYNIWHFMIDAAHQRKGVRQSCFGAGDPIYQNKAVWAVRHGAAHLQPGKPGSVRLYTDFGFCPTGTVRRKGTGALPEARPGAAEYGDKSIIRQQKTRPAGRIYFGWRARFYCRGTTGFAYACKALYYRHARPVAQGTVRPAAKILLPAARKRAYSSIVRCFPALFSSIRF